MVPKLLLVAIAMISFSVHAAGPDRAFEPKTGKEVFEKWCMPCHGDGREYPGTVALNARYKGDKPGVLEKRTDLTPEVIEYFVRHGVSIMPFFRKTEISDRELELLSEYLSQAGGN